EVDKEFGTGAVKVTPAHDALDYAIGKRYGLAEIQVIGLDGKMTKECPDEFQGLSTSEAQKKVIEQLKNLDLLGKIKKHVKPLSKHDRCGKVIEPLISDQWWIHTDHPKFSLKKEAIKAVKEGKIEIIPKHFEKTFFHWMENLEDWCISRQLWWGHQIPAYYCEDCGNMEVSKSHLDCCSKCDSKNIKQDTDTFDTWFSSGQWAHNTVCTFGEDEYFPGSLMVMGRDILFFWACRMIMMSLYAKREVPFKTLYLTGLINDRHGKKMSKSKGNGIDPLEMADKYGTDALRLSLFIGSTPGNDMRLYEEKIEGYRNFVNKLWNAARFVQLQVQSSKLKVESSSSHADSQSCHTEPVEVCRDSKMDSRLHEDKKLSETDKWILSRTNNLIKDVTEALDNYRYSEAGQKLYDFTWNEFCDWYLELSKGEKQNPEVLLSVLSTLLKLLHPFIPFVTEVLWKELFSSPFLKGDKGGFNITDKISPNPSLKRGGHEGLDSLKGEGLLALESWPQYDSDINFQESEKNIEFLMKIISEIRSTRAEAKINVSKKVEAKVLSKGEEDDIIKRYSEEIIKMGRLSKLERLEGEVLPSNTIQAIVSQKTTIYIIEEIDEEEEKKRIQKDLEIAKKQLENLEKRLSNKGYVEKAPAHLIEQTKKEKMELEEKIGKLEKG
ncbi:class I tRNA ligase family protein, partial [Candidatus Peregrinibacteria bacterium]|nr:class I tRNA ligase family protein [Candidatus Peregrinibacteria bacterium]